MVGVQREPRDVELMKITINTTLRVLAPFALECLCLIISPFLSFDDLRRYPRAVSHPLVLSPSHTPRTRQPQLISEPEPNSSAPASWKQLLEHRQAYR